MDRRTICITGGHLTPALAVIDEIVRTHPEWKIVFIGRRHAGDADTHESEEYRIISGRGIEFHELKTGRLLRTFSWRTFVSLLRTPAGFFSAYSILRQVRPDVVVSFGGYLALPVAYAARILGIPVVTHEQTHVPGLANRLIAGISAKICVSYADTLVLFPKDRTVVTGLPVRESIFHPPASPPFPIDGTLPVVYITGGATGARSMNHLIYPIVPKLIRSHVVVHQVGSAWLSEARKIRAGLRGDRRARYHVFGYLDEMEHAYVLNQAAVCVGRSGANTVAEITALGKPAVFIPLPWSAGNEQRKNTEELVSAGRAAVLDQNHCTPQDIVSAIERMEAVHPQRESALPTGGRTAAADIVQVVSSVLQA